jgi:hypothetical protein
MDNVGSLRDHYDDQRLVVRRHWQRKKWTQGISGFRKNFDPAQEWYDMLFLLCERNVFVKDQAGTV